MRRTPRLLAAIVLLALALVDNRAVAAGSADETRRLAAGEVITSLQPTGKGPDEGIGRGAIDAPLERVARALSDLDHWDEFMPFLEESDAKPQADGSILSAQRMAFPAPIGERHYTIRVRTRSANGSWSEEWSAVPGSGNLKAHHGSWELTRLASGKTLASLRIYTEPGGLAPSSVMNGATRKMLGWIFDGLRQQVRRSRYDG